MATARESIPRIVGALQSNPGVESVLVAGSVRDGADDEVSDLDLWVQAPSWAPEQCDGLFLAGTTATVGDGPLFHAIDCEGVIVDVRFGPTPPPEYVALDRQSPEPFEPVQLELPTYRTAFWINSYKSRKPLWRGLDAMVIFGLQFERMALIKAWMEQETGVEPGNDIFSIHGLTSVVRNHITPQRWKILGLPLRTRREILFAIQTYREEMLTLSPNPSPLAEMVMQDPVFTQMRNDHDFGF